MRLGRPAIALRDFDRALLLRPDSASDHFERGNALFDLGRFAEAIEAYTEAIDFGFGVDYTGTRSQAVVFYNRGLAASKLGDSQAALADYAEALDRHPDYSDALYNRAILLDRIGRSAEALEDLERGAKLALGDGSFLTSRAEALLHLNRPADALAACEEALALDPRDDVAFYNKACALNRMGFREEAAGWLRTAIRMDSENAKLARNDPDLRSVVEESWSPRRPRSYRRVV